MKSGLLNCSKQLIAFISFLLPATVLAAPDYTFTAAALQSGTDLQVGAVYRFTAVKPGVDALVTITFITAGCSVTKIDNDGTGYSAAFQPEVLVPSKTTGYAQFNILFVVTATSTPMLQTEIPATAIDIDGNASLWGGALNEYDQISMGASSYIDYNLLGGQLSVATPAGWMTASNTGGVEYGGISTSTTAVMVTTVNAGATFFNYRTGVNNQSNIDNLPRQKSLYFQKFTYPNSVLAANDVLLFKGIAKKDQVDLAWQLSNSTGRQSVVLERSTDGTHFTPARSFAVKEQTGVDSWSDPVTSADIFYRLKITYLAGATAYSHVLPFRNLLQVKTPALDIYPTLIRSSAIVSFMSSESGHGTFYIINQRGETVMHKLLQATPGKNVFSITLSNSLPAGIYMAVLYTDGLVYSKRVVR